MGKENPVFGYITEKFLACLEQGIIPWRKSWDAFPQNYDGRKYRGCNPFWLNAQAMVCNFKSPYWLTKRKINELGGQFSGKSSMVVYWNWSKKTDKETGEVIKKYAFLRYFNVWNYDQTTGIALPEQANKETTIEEPEAIIRNSPVRPTISFTGNENRARYSPTFDKITMPPIETFKNSALYYSTLFHELVHSTGHKSRLNRDITNLFGDHNYSFEELVAEMGASFLLSICGIANEETETNNMAYVQNWASALNRDKKMISSAGAQAQKAVDLILGTKFEED